MSYFDYHYYALNNFKRGQLESNRQDVINTLGILGDATPEQIPQSILRKEIVGRP